MTTDINRRNFLKWSGTLAIGFTLPSIGKAAEINQIAPSAIEMALNPFVLITKENNIIVFCPHPDFGQGTTQSIPMLVAEELGVSMKQIEVRFTGGEEKFGSQFVGGSASVRGRWKPMRQVGAAAREMLTKAAANRWGIPESECACENGKITNTKTQVALTFGELVEEASKLEVPKEPKLKDKKDFKLIGKSVPRLDFPDKTNGKAQFGIDFKIPNMVYAVMLHAPQIHNKVKSIDDVAALKVKGVQKVIKAQRPLPYKTLEAVAVIANSTWAAMEGRKALKVEWEAGDLAKISTDAYFTQLQKSKTEDGFTLADKTGSVSEGLAGSANTIEAEYSTPFMAHAPMEPENATAWVQGDKVEVWAPHQSPDWAVQQIAGTFGFKPENIKVNVLNMGGSFGRKGYLDYLLEAVYISQQIKQPVKLTWTREDDLTQGPVRPGMLNVVKGGIDKDGGVVALEHKIVGSWFGQQLWKAPAHAMTWWDEGIKQHDAPYKIANRAHKFVHIDSEIPMVWWRSVYSSTNVFASESFMDELAHSGKKDPLELRLSLLQDSPRFISVLNTLKEKSGYGKTLPAGQSIGIAISKTFETICAHAVLVSKQGKGVKIEKVTSVIDCGVAVNPDQVKAQTESNIVMGLSAAMKNSITMVDGKIQETNFHLFTPLRINETPKMEVHIMQNDEEPTGVGEPGLPPLAPALCNAIFNLTGKRIRKLPFDLSDLG
jgi:isoquinoline 1-oxidoreductase subunit beta